MSSEQPPSLTKREREIMDILYEREEATAAQILESMTQPPSYSAVRALLRLLEERGHITHKIDGPRYLYRPATAKQEARKSALLHVVKTFFGGSAQQAILNLVENAGGELSREELDALQAAIEAARKDGR